MERRRVTFAMLTPLVLMLTDGLLFSPCKARKKVVLPTSYCRGQYQHHIRSKGKEKLHTSCPKSMSLTCCHCTVGCACVFLRYIKICWTALVLNFTKSSKKTQVKPKSKNQKLKTKTNYDKINTLFLSFRYDGITPRKGFPVASKSIVRSSEGTLSSKLWLMSSCSCGCSPRVSGSAVIKLRASER